MRVEVMQHFGLRVPLNQAGYYETAHHKELMKDVRGAINEGAPTLAIFSVVDDRSGTAYQEYRCIYGEDVESALRFLFNAMAPKGGLIAVCGVVGSGKTALLRRLQEILDEERKITVSKSLSVEKRSIKLATLIAALFYELSTEKQVRIPSGEKRERELRELVRKNKKPVALFVDEAHDLNRHTLIELKRLMELVEGGGGRLAVVLAGHPKLRNDLRRPTMEEIGYRTEVFSLDGIAGSQREYIRWLLGACAADKKEAETILTVEAIDVLASMLRTPLQIQMHLNLALEASYQSGERPVSVEVVESVLSRQIDDLEPTLTRHGYSIKDLVEQFDSKAGEIKALFNNTLDATRTAALREKMLRAGLPI